ncbi:BglG family transcription antiterminator [Dendrosporobacter sp. 1207_IL3150]|uniref:BglG family transcription antiterminator n=1 Tax=Dendrosporobacter sp. 1207_IL3150 TaxID=3084054 RepID=UPI002FDB337C
MQVNKVNLRVKNILQRLCSQPDYITISSIAKDVGVSAKTVLREMDEVERWLEANACSLSKKTGLGIKIEGNVASAKELLKSQCEDRTEEAYSPKARQTLIISELLKNQQPVKLFNFAALFKVTESTISNDLDKIEQWFSTHRLNLIRKQGLGVYVEGSETEFRKATINFIYENIDEDQLIRIIRRNLNRSNQPSNDVDLQAKRRLLNLIEPQSVYKLESSIREAERKMGHKLTDNAYVGLIVHLALAIQRLRIKEEIKIEKEFLDELKKLPEFSIALDIAASAADSFSIEIPEDEVGYITMHLKGSKNRTDSIKSSNKTIGNFELVKLSREMIKVAERLTGHFLSQHDSLLVGLVNHLGPAISRLKMNLEIRNPLLEKIKVFYPDLIEVSKNCAVVIEKNIGIKMPEAEIAYIAMHFGAAIENSQKFAKPIYRCAIACSTGIGTSRLLATRIEKEYDNIQVVDIISTMYIEEGMLQEQDIDFIIATVTIDNCIIPAVTVNPLLFEEDKKRINKLIKLVQNRTTSSIAPKKSSLKLKDKLLLLNEYNQGVIQILDNFFIVDDNESSTIDDLIAKLSNQIGNDHINQQAIADALRSREEKGSTFITGHRLILLHCRTDAVQSLHFGLVRIGKELHLLNGRNELEEAKLGVVMLAPENCTKEGMETISYLSRMLIERAGLLEVLLSGYSEAISEISNIYQGFYKSKSANLLGG